MTTPRLSRRKKQFSRSWRARDEKSHARFSRRMKNQSMRWYRRPAVEGVVLVLLLLFWAGLLLYHPYFQITSVQVEVTNGENEAEYMAWLEQRLQENHLLSLSSNYFATQVEGIQATIRETFPVQSLLIAKEFPGTLRVVVTEERDELLVYGHDGVLVRAFTNGAVEPVAKSDTPSVQEEIEVKVPIEDPEEGSEELFTVETERVFSYGGTFQALKRVYGDVPVAFADLPAENVGQFVEEFLHFTTQVESFSSAGEVGDEWFFVQPKDAVYQFELLGVSDWKIIFDQRFEFDQQLEKLHHVLQTEDLNTLEKVDVRYGETIFVTRKKAI